MKISIVDAQCEADHHPPGGYHASADGKTVLCVQIAETCVCVECLVLPVLETIEAWRDRRASSDDPDVRADEATWSGLTPLAEFIDHILWAMPVRDEWHERQRDVEAALREAASITGVN